MSVLMSRPSVRRWPLLFALLLLTAPAFADSITIGSVTFLGTSDPNHPAKARFLLQLNTQGITFDRYFRDRPYSLEFNFQVVGWDAGGLFSTIPVTNAYLIAMHYCPCEGAVFNLSLQNSGAFRLANGRLFTPGPTITVGLYPPPGQTYLQYGQGVALVLNSQPSPVSEPASLLLFASGLLATAGVVWRKRRALAR
jgi:hypothetical protein